MASSLGTFFNPRVSYMQSDSTDAALQSWARQIVVALNNLPPTSVFSFPNPNSHVTAIPGTWGHNVASGASAVWFKQSGTTTTGWVALA